MEMVISPAGPLSTEESLWRKNVIWGWLSSPLLNDLLPLRGTLLCSSRCITNECNEVKVWQTKGLHRVQNSGLNLKLNQWKTCLSWEPRVKPRQNRLRIRLDPKCGQPKKTQTEWEYQHSWMPHQLSNTYDQREAIRHSFQHLFWLVSTIFSHFISTHWYVGFTNVFLFVLLS